MKELLKAQEMARRDIENVAVHAAYARRRKRRRISGKRGGLTRGQPEGLDWREAGREAGPARAAGFFLP